MENRLRSTGLVRWLCLFLISAVLLGPVGGSVAAGTDESAPSPGEMSLIRMQNYASLPGLVAMVGRDAIAQFQGFFDLAPVSIEPFVVLNTFSTKKRISLLGATLADQVAAAASFRASPGIRRLPPDPYHRSQYQGGASIVPGQCRDERTNLPGTAQLCLPSMKETVQQQR